ncbi:hypothetical protein THAOC_00397, partial [Thalassiosira oceanica]
MSSGGEQRAANFGRVSLDNKDCKGFGKNEGSRFLELKSNVVVGLTTAHLLLEEHFKTDSLTRKDAIAAETKIREVIQQAYDEWNELDEIYKKETRKKKSKLTNEKLIIQQTVVVQLKQELNKIKDLHQVGSLQYLHLSIGTLAALDVGESDLSRIGPSHGGMTWQPGTGGATLTGSQKLQLQGSDLDADFDRNLDKIEECSQGVHRLATMQGEEVRSH